MTIFAQQDTLPPAFRPGEHTQLKFQTEYGFNDVWGHHGNFDIEAQIPLNRHFDLTAGAQFSTGNVWQTYRCVHLSYGWRRLLV